jgi:hypothetical protein
MTVGENWYRYEDVALPNGYFDVDGEYVTSGPSTIRVELRECKVVRETPKGVWVEKFDGHETFVRHSATKKYAYSTLEEARKGFIARKNAQLRILNAGVRRCQHALLVMKHENELRNIAGNMLYNMTIDKLSKLEETNQ